MNRRESLLLGLGAGLGSLGASKVFAKVQNEIKWKSGIEGQRKADLGNGYYLNPIVSGDRPDPSILVDGEDYYMTFSTFEAYPGLHIWHSRDLVNWQPIGFALSEYVGSVWAPELIKFQGKYYIYFAVKRPNANTIFVISADNIKGPWSKPIDLELPNHIDPGYASDGQGNRYLFLSGGDRVKIDATGTKTIGIPEHVYDPWKYPPEWEVEGFSPEGPKILKRGDYYYLILAIGGTAGPPTGHMVICARSKSLNGPWENCPHNPLVRSKSKLDLWWSRGHATIFKTPAGEYWSVYHGYERDFITLGRQCLLAPIQFSKDNWPIFGGDDLSKPIKKPKSNYISPNGLKLSDDFYENNYGTKWNFIQPAKDEASRLKIGNGKLELIARGLAPSNSSPLGFVVGDRNYEIEIDVELIGNAWGGLLLYYDRMLYCGLGFTETNFITHQYGLERGKPKHGNGKRMKIKLRNRENIVSFWSSKNGNDWQKFDRGMEVSGYNHNVRGGFMMLKPCIYACGDGAVIYRNLKYKAF